MTRRLVALGLALVVSSTDAAGQSLFGHSGKRHLPREVVGTANAVVAAGDLDADGDVDLVFGRFVLENDGHAIFTVRTTLAPANGYLVTGAAIADADGDGDPDVFLAVAGSLIGGLWLLVNDGTGGLTPVAGAFPAPAWVGDLAATDVDADGDVDVVVGSHPLEVYRNDGTGRFTAVQHLPEVRTYFLGVADLDRDGAVDIVVEDTGSVPRVFRNDGRGIFAETTGAWLPPIAARGRIAIGDVDGDGDVDLGVGDPTALQLLLNDGSGRFVDASDRVADRIGGNRIVAFGDVDADGDLDLLRGSPADVLWNDGGGRFTRASQRAFEVPLLPEPRVLAVDLDRDGASEVCASSGMLLLDDGRGRFSDGGEALIPSRISLRLLLAAGDIDGDGDTDLAYHDLHRVALVINDANARYALDELGRIPALGANPGAVVLHDLDGDRDPDLHVATWPDGSGRSLVLVNDGRGFFRDETAARWPHPPADAVASAVGDVDGDGAPDVVLAQRSGAVLYTNDGSGRFPISVPIGAGPFSQVFLVDVDRDGAPDVIGPWSVLRNVGGGFFVDRTAAWLQGMRSPFGFAIGDVDGDGDPDIVFPREFAPNGLLLNDGTGRFTDATATHMPQLASRNNGLVQLADFDEDGDLDVLFGFDHGPLVAGDSSLYVNDGTGRFTPSFTLLPSDTVGDRVRALDIDGDRDVDLLSADTLVNRQRHVETPYRARLGQLFRTIVWGRAGHARTFEVAIGALSTGRSRRDLGAFGAWQLDPAVTVELVPLYLPPGSGRGVLDFTIPRAASLRGVELSAQLVIVDPLGISHVTNVATDVIR